jgi:hypothetical protein
MRHHEIAEELHVVKGSTLSVSDSWEQYKCLRSYIDNQAAWINSRVTWLLTIQGFLFASYTLALQAMGAPEAKCNGALEWLIFLDSWVLPLLGIAVSVLGFLASFAAVRAITKTHKIWTKELKHIHEQVKRVAVMRGGGLLDDGGHGFVHRCGYLPPLGVPFFTSIAWFFLWLHSRYPKLW